MFAKLLKYEWKANYKLFGLLSLVALGIGVVGGALIRCMFLMSDMVKNEFALAMSEMSLLSMAMVCMVAVGVYATAVQYINYYRFYKHKFTDEGYLTFTLPVKAESIFWSSFLHILIWMGIASVVASVASTLMFSIGIGPWFVEVIIKAFQEVGAPPLPEITPQEWAALGKTLWEALVTIVKEGFLLTGAPLYYVLISIQSLITPFYTVVLTMTCIVIGSVLVKRMKLLVSVGIYLGFTSIIATLMQISVYVPSFVATFDFNHYYYWMSIPMMGQILLQVGVIVGGCILSIHLMKKRLNLP